MDSSRKFENPSPETRSNIFSKLFFCWIMPLFIKGYKSDLQMRDIYNTTEADKCSVLADELERNWDVEVRKATEKKGTPSLQRAIFKTFVKPYSFYGIILFIKVVVFKTIQPIVLAEYIRYFENPEAYKKNTGENAGWFLGTAVVLTAFMTVIFYHHGRLGCQRVGMRVRAACCSLVYRKLLRLSQASLGQTASGQLVNLLSNDLQRFDLASNFLHFTWIMPFQAVIGFYVMYRSVGIAALSGVVAMALEALPLQGYLSKVQGQLRSKIAEKTDYRVKLMSEIVSGIRVIKMYAWEKSFAKVVEMARKQEINIITKTSYVRGFSLSLMVFTERLSLYLTLITFALLGNRLTGPVAFSLAQIFNSIQLYMCINYPIALAFFAESKVSVRRLEQFLMLQENGTRAILSGNTISSRQNGSIKIEKATASWSLYPEIDTLVDINLSLKPSTLCCIVGNVGSGKSSFLQMLLRELPLNCGIIDICGEISYASQEPWLFVSSVRDNILFGKPFDQKKYDEVVRVCALETDFQQFPYGDKTLVEERGVSLSGGQRARINLARTVYAEADIYLFDDPLSAVDTHVGKHLFEHCIRGYLNNKTRILVTHQLQFLKQADIIVILQNGKISKTGTYNELSETELVSLYPESSHDEKHNEEDSVKKHVPAETAENAVSKYDEEPEENCEIMNSGSIPTSTYAEYYRHGAGLCVMLCLVFLFIIAQMASNACDLWVTYWTNKEDVSQNYSTSYLSDDDLTLSANSSSLDDTLLYSLIYDNISDYMNDTTQIVLEDENARHYFYIIVYSVFMALSIILTPIRSLLFYKIFMNASKGLHNKMFKNVLAAPMKFFDTNPSGRILNRFSNDMGIIDELLPRATLDAIQVFLVMSGILMMVFIVTPWMIGPAVILGALFYYFRLVYLRTVQDVKRLEGIARAPVFSHISASLYGMPTIRASKAERMIIAEFECLQDRHTSTWYMYIASSEIFGFYLDMISTIFLGLVTFQFMVLSDENTLTGNVGLVISQCLVLTGMLQIGVRQTAEVASNMISIERVLQYTKLEKENSYEHVPTKNFENDWSHFAKLRYINPDRNWPQSGKIVFRNTYLRYSPGADPVLKNLSLEINTGEKVGIVGRTGAGKSTLISALFRLCPIEGSILIDDIDISKIRLNELRSNISIIPQEPVLFSATVRYNLDPFEKVSDETLWKALENVELRNVIESLDQIVNEGGSNFSAGQRQLMCLARAIVRNNKILVMDEATANVDPHTDSLIQKTIRENFKSCTVLTIAHRLNTIMDSDKVLVMNAGEAVEFAHPFVLLQNSNGYFSKMVKQTGPVMEMTLKRIAKDDYEIKTKISRRSNLYLN